MAEYATYLLLSIIIVVNTYTGSAYQCQAHILTYVFKIHNDPIRQVILIAPYYRLDTVQCAQDYPPRQLQSQDFDPGSQAQKLCFLLQSSRYSLLFFNFLHLLLSC